MHSRTPDRVSAAQEDYLEAILGLVRAHRAARVRDIAAGLGVHKSTVTAALHTLAEKGLVTYAPYRRVVLTDEGRAIAERVAHDHRAICDFLRDVLGIAEDVAERNACRMEHVMDKPVLDRLIAFASPRAPVAGGPCRRPARTAPSAPRPSSGSSRPRRGA